VVCFMNMNAGRRLKNMDLLPVGLVKQYEIMVILLIGVFLCKECGGHPTKCSRCVQSSVVNLGL